MFENLAVTLLQQSHVCPLPMTAQPVYWNYDHALRLYPLPDVVVVADPSRAADFAYEGCTCINPVHYPPVPHYPISRHGWGSADAYPRMPVNLMALVFPLKQRLRQGTVMRGFFQPLVIPLVQGLGVRRGGFCSMLSFDLP
jgi:hypothetical protein